MNNISIRPATIADDARVTNLLTASYPALMATHYGPDILALALPLMTRANPALLSSGTFYVAETGDGRIVGCGGWTVERPGTDAVVDGLAHIRHFAIDPDWTGNGIGRALYERCQQRAGHAGVTRFECYASLNAQQFYAALGFHPIETISVAMPDNVNFEAVHMQRDI